MYKKGDYMIPQWLIYSFDILISMIVVLYTIEITLNILHKK